MSIRVERWSEEGKPDARELQRRLEAEGYSVSGWSDAAGALYDPHSHAADQTHWIISGAIEMRVAGETYTLGAGDRDYLPANTEHAAFVPGDSEVVYLIGVKD